MASLAIAALAAGCGINLPTDPSGTLTNTVGGTIRVGYSPEVGLIEGNDAVPTGPLVDLAEGFADEIHAKVAWSMHGEEKLVVMIEEDALDLGVGGFTEQTPWGERVGVTRWYTGVPGAEQRPVVMLVQSGENAFLLELESFLDDAVGS